jgi:hypothetical protein
MGEGEVCQRLNKGKKGEASPFFNSSVVAKFLAKTVDLVETMAYTSQKSGEKEAAGCRK